MTRFLLLICTMWLGTHAAAETLTRGGNFAVDASTHDRLLMDVAGGIWVLPLSGGVAEPVAGVPRDARRPRWSPDGRRIVYTADANGTSGLHLLSLDTGEWQALGTGGFLDLHPSWHPDGERIVFTSDRGDTGLDIWELDLPSGLAWRLSSRPGDETQPAWSADGRDLVYVHHDGEQWSLILRPFGEPEEVLVTGETRLAGPSWRPDGSLVMFWREEDEGVSLDMVILSQPRLVRRYASGEDFVTAPVSWPDRHRLYYTAGGLIRQRHFNAWSSRTIPFRATLAPQPRQVAARVRRTLPRVAEPQGTLVIHAARLFDGIGSGYVYDRDVIIDGGHIRAVEAHADRPGQIVIDMGDLAVLPGLVDAHARLSDTANEDTGPLLLAAGVTTVVAQHPEAEHLNTIWSGKELPGPRLLLAEDWPAGMVSGLADAMTPGLDALLGARAARLIDFDGPVPRRFGEPPRIDQGFTDMVLGSEVSGMPAGIGTQGELRAMQAAGLTPAQALRAAGVNAAAALGVDPRLGRIAPGAVADLVLVDGDPLGDVADALKVVAIVRNGRFFSVAGLIERSAGVGNVE